MPSLAFGRHAPCHDGSRYIGVGLSALLVSTGRAMREPRYVERVTGLAPRFFHILTITNILAWELARMTWRYMKKFLILIFSAALALPILSSCDSKKKATCDLEELSTDMRYHYTECDADKWEEVAEKYQDINERLNDAELTPEELRHIGKIRGEIAGYATNEAARELHQVIRDALNEASGFVDGFFEFAIPESLVYVPKDLLDVRIHSVI